MICELDTVCRSEAVKNAFIVNVVLVYTHTHIKLKLSMENTDSFRLRTDQSRPILGGRCTYYLLPDAKRIDAYNALRHNFHARVRQLTSLHTPLCLSLYRMSHNKTPGLKKLSFLFFSVNSIGFAIFVICFH